MNGEYSFGVPLFIWEKLSKEIKDMSGIQEFRFSTSDYITMLIHEDEKPSKVYYLFDSENGLILGDRTMNVIETREFKPV